MTLSFVLALSTSACGPVPPPQNAYTSGPDLINDFEKQRHAIRSFRITGRVDHFGEAHRVQGKIFLFAELPGALRIELVSPFGNPLSVLTVDKGIFTLHDLRDGRYLTGPAEPCNIARLVRIPLPPDDVIRILTGHTPVIEGNKAVTWDRNGFYKVEIENPHQSQHLEVDPKKQVLELQRSHLKDTDGTIFDITYDKWVSVSGIAIPHEIRVKMPRHKADLLLRYDKEGVELNVSLPKNAFTPSPKDGVHVEQVTCD